MKRNTAETILGAIVIVVALCFLVFSYRSANLHASDGYSVTADFAGTGGLKTGDNVLLSGVKVGQVEKVTLVPETYLARVHINVGEDIKLPTDTAALISSESLLGGRYLALEPGADEEIIPPGGRIEYTQAPQNLEQLLGQFIFTMQDEGKKSPAESAPVPAPEVTDKAEPDVTPHSIPEIMAPAEDAAPENTEDAGDAEHP